jgi:hypothetical protein
MKTARYSRTVISIGAVTLMMALLACGLPGSQVAATPTLFVPPTTAPEAGTQAPAPTEQAAASSSATPAFVGSAGEGDPLDLCTLPTPDEVQAVLGGPATRTLWYDYGQNCALFLDDTHYLIVQAGHDPDGKVMHLAGMEGVRNRITDPSALQLMDEIVAQQATLNLPDLVRKALPVWRAAGYSAEEDTGVGDWSVWFYGSPATAAGFNLGEYGAGRASGAWLAVYIPATDEAAARALLKPLAAALLDRLPDNFTPTGTTSE